jgi:hypothetical protein
MITLSQMNITDKIIELQAEYNELEKTKNEASERMKEIKRQIGKLHTIVKHAESVFSNGKE